MEKMIQDSTPPLIIRSTSKIGVWEYAKKNGITVQTVYRWIREGKVPDDQFERVMIARIKIEEGFSPKDRRKKNT